MGVAAGPNTVEDGLVLGLDAGNPKNYNVGISTNWTDKVGGNNGTLVNGTYHNDGPFVGAGYVEFDGSTEYLSIADSNDLDLSTGDFTIEFWVYANSLTNFDGIIGKRTATFTSNSWRIAYGSTNSNINLVHTDNTSETVSYASAPSLNTWTHYAFARESGTLRAFKNGVKETDVSYTYDFSNTYSLHIGTNDGSNYSWHGNISNVRVVKGTALYTSNFTPPTRTLTAVTNTKLLTCQGNSISDASSSGHTITANGDISLTKEPFAGAGAVAFDGSGDYLSITDSDDFNFGSEDFTVEAWITGANGGSRISSVVLNQSNGSATSNSAFYFGAGTDGTSLYLSTSGSSWTNNIVGSGTVDDGSWHHVVWQRNGNTIGIYLDGVLDVSGSFSGTIFNSSRDVQIGIQESDGSDFKGKISNLRILKGTALYTAAFTPPSRTLEPIENTVLLTCQGQNIKDASSNAHTITSNGDVNPTIVSSSFEFDGTNDYITTNTNANFTLGASEDFALEWWEYWTLTSPTTMHGHVGVFDNGCLHIASYTGNQQFAMHYGTWRYFANAYVVPFKWTHYVVTGQSQNIRFYQNGELKSTNTGTAYTVSGTPGATKYFEVGRNTYGSTGYSKMKASSVKFYKGKSLSTAEVTQNYNATKGRYGL